MKNCIFCKIERGELEASIVYEDDKFIAIMDAYPLSKGHCLVIPRAHVTRLDELNNTARKALFDIGHNIVEAQKKCGLGVSGTNILLNDGKAANQTVPHLHLHLIPREKGDLFKAIPRLFLHITGIFGFQAKRKTLDELAEQLSAALK